MRIRFNFPGFAPFRLISWSEWFAAFDGDNLIFVYDHDRAADGHDGPRYRIVNASDWAMEIG